MGSNLAHKVIASHLISGDLSPGTEIEIRIDQTLTQDATGTLVMLELEAIGLERVRTEVSAQYVDHNLVQADYRNADDHRFLDSAARRFGLHYSRPGNGVSHPVHQERFGIPGKTLLGSDSHTPAAGAIGMLAMGAGGLDVAMAMAGEPYRLAMPEIWGIELVGELRPWVSAKDVILEMLRRHGVAGGVGRILEYRGPGLAGLSAMDRHVIANMGTELGATTSIFPADDEVRRFLAGQGRGGDHVEIAADAGATYDREEVIELGELEPLIAMPSSPGNVRPVREVAGEPIGQAYIGSSANPGYRDFAIAAAMVAGRHVADGVSFDVNPTSRQILANLVADGHLGSLVRAGARIHQAGCNGCIGMGQAPATETYSLRTVPRNFPGRSGTVEDKVCLVSPETAAASALTGAITDPRTLDMEYPRVADPERPRLLTELLRAPDPDGIGAELVTGPNIKSLPSFDPLEDVLELPVILVVGDDVSTDEILPAGMRVLPLRSNIEAISEFAFADVDPGYARRARELGAHAIVGGANYGQGSSREHAALAPRYLGLRAVIAESYARIHRQNLINFGVLPLRFEDPADREALGEGDSISIADPGGQLDGERIEVATSSSRRFWVTHDLSRREIEVVRAGGLINLMRRRLAA
jgi:aconitate hydratase